MFMSMSLLNLSLENCSCDDVSWEFLLVDQCLWKHGLTLVDHSCLLFGFRFFDSFFDFSVRFRGFCNNEVKENNVSRNKCD